MTSTFRSRLFILGTAVAALVLTTMLPATAEAQRRYRRSAPVIVIGGFVYQHHYWRYRSWHQWGPYRPYGYFGIRDLTASLRVDAEPRQAQVFVDGYYAGLVDEFDGVFQRLRVEPGGRTITIFLEGYRTEQQHLYLRPGSDQRVRLNLVPLAPGERSEPPPVPVEERSQFEDEGFPPTGQPPGAGGGERSEVAPAPARYGTLSLRIRPADAEVLIDGERWSGGDTQGIVTVQLTEGRHSVEVRRPGMSTYTEDVLIRRDRTLTLNVALE